MRNVIEYAFYVKAKERGYPRLISLLDCVDLV
jgi:hypothetical protein